MANPTLHWRMLAPVTVTDQTAAGFMQALYQMGTATTYADGTTRTPGTFASPGTASLPASLGTGSAWTWNYDSTTFATGGKTAIYGYAPTTTAINQAVIIGGTSNVTGAVWKQLSTDARSASYLYMGIAKNSGVYTSWNNATTPFTAGDFTGFGFISTPISTYNYVIMWECEEAVAVQFVTAATGVVNNAMAGAFVDPLSANTANAETDGRLYGVATSGGAANMATTWLGTGATASAPLFVNSASAGDMHCVTFTPGAGTTVATSRFGNFTPAVSFTSRNGDLPQIPIQVWNGTQYVGQLRQIFMTRDSITGNEWQVGAAPKGYLLSASPSTACDAVILTY